jgi:hypothetical protein
MIQLNLNQCLVLVAAADIAVLVVVVDSIIKNKKKIFIKNANLNYYNIKLFFYLCFLNNSKIE